MKLVFAGSPRFAIPTLEKLVEAGYDIHGVVTQPDRPSGREQQLQASPLKEEALRLRLPVYQPEKIKSDEGKELMTRLGPEALVVVGYGQILPQWLLELPRFGCINLHASLLPAYRGAAPIQWAVVNGEKKTGVTTMLMDPGMDTGPILMQWETEIGPEETSIELGERMSGPGAALMIHTLRGLEAGTLKPQPQDNSRATRAPLLKKEHGRIDWNLTAADIFNRVRGFLPWPGAYTSFRGQRLQIWKARPDQNRDGTVTQHASHEPGELLVDGDELRVACGGTTTLQLVEVQLEGKRRLPAEEFVHGARPKSGERFDPNPA
ncbi:MAG: methionyl-tRNA formyltransferase [Acidobacteria bacterium]|nr:methionyl-tRNA formyltransferase [Acidobacteriota bacterium]